MSEGGTMTCSAVVVVTTSHCIPAGACHSFGVPPKRPAAYWMRVWSGLVSRNVSSLAGRVFPLADWTCWPMRIRPISANRRCRSMITWKLQCRAHHSFGGLLHPPERFEDVEERPEDVL